MAVVEPKNTKSEKSHCRGSQQNGDDRGRASEPEVKPIDVMQSEEQQLGKKVNGASAACEETLKGSESQKKTKGLAQEKIFEE